MAEMDVKELAKTIAYVLKTMGQSAVDTLMGTLDEKTAESLRAYQGKEQTGVDRSIGVVPTFASGTTKPVNETFAGTPVSQEKSTNEMTEEEFIEYSKRNAIDTSNMAPENQNAIKTMDSETFAAERGKNPVINEEDNVIMSAYTGADGVPLTRDQLSSMPWAERKKILNGLKGGGLSRANSEDLIKMENNYLDRVNKLYSEQALRR